MNPAIDQFFGGIIMKKESLFLSLTILSTILFAGCSPAHSNATTDQTTVSESSTLAKPSSVEESTKIAETISSTNTDPSLAAEESPSESERTYVFSEQANAELSLIFEHCYYSGFGHDKVLQFSSLSQDEASALLFSALLNPGTVLYQGTNLSADGLSKYSIPYTTAKKFFQEAFGADLDSYDFSEYMENDNIIWHGGDYGSDVPGALIDTVTQSSENDLITIKGDAFDIYDADMSITYAKFTATLIPSDSSYFDGNTLVSFTYKDNTTDDHPDIDLSKYFDYY